VSYARNTGLILMALAVLLYVVVTGPGYEAAADAGRQEERVRHETEESARRLADSERRAAFLGRAAALMNESGSGPGESMQRVRAGIVRMLREAGVSHVRLEVRPVSPPAVAGVNLSADARFSDLLRLVSLLDRPGSGLVLQRVTFSADPSSVTVDAVAIGAAP
jgi:hypothetical protein